MPGNSMAKTLVIGLGNPLLGDDGVGWRVAEQVQQMIQASQSLVEVDCLSVGGLRLMERLVGHDRAILIDAITTRQQPPGTVSHFLLEDLPYLIAGHLGSAHDTGLQTALSLGRALGVSLPEEVTIVGVESQCLFDFTEELTPPVAASVSYAARMVLKLLEE